jgi:sialate O-acetylesterase
MMKKSFAFILALFCSAFIAQAKVTLHGLFTDNMVLQRDAAVAIWGWAADGEVVTVQFQDQKVKATSKGGQWMVKLKKMKASATPADLKITSKESDIVLRNVVVGEVWIASGQSNMEMPLRNCEGGAKDIAAAATPNIRLYTVPRIKASHPTNNLNAVWYECKADTVTNFSGVAYYFARDLQKDLNVPIGIIHTSWGGSPAEGWMSEKTLAANADYKRDLLDPYAEGQTNAAKRVLGSGWRPAELYNGMIAPLIPFTIAGAIWYQGESNAGRAWQYRTLFPDMIKNWRRDWDQGNFPFLLVQLAPYTKVLEQPADSDWAELREAQYMATQVLPNVGMAVITDVGNPDDIHPKRKEPVGARLALAARAIAYGEKIVYSGPVFKKMKVKDDKAILTFDNVGEGLEARDGELKGFAICGEDHKFVWAKAVIENNQVIVSSSEVTKPVAVRYGWAAYPVVNLWNKNGLPACPFRTDEFPMKTQPQAKS